jgi:PAS domain S-box-containing protein
VDATGDIAVVGGGEVDRSALVSSLRAAGISARAFEALSLDGPSSAPPLLLVTGDVVTLVSEARDVPLLADVPILAVVAAVPTSAATDVLAAGATEVIQQPISAAVLAARVRNLLRGRRVTGSWSPGSLAPSLLAIQDLLAQGGDDVGVLVSVLESLSETLGFPRASLVAHIDGSEHAFVIAATDDPSRSQFTLSIAEYPEIAECIRTGAPVLLDDAQEHPLTAPVAHKLASKGVRGLAVLPVSWRGRPVGVILLRKQSAGIAHMVGRGTDYARLVAALLAGHLRHGSVLEALRDQTHRISRVRYEAERRLRGIESLKEHFEAASDGVVILDDAGRILFLNRAAERITGFARDGLLGSELADLVTPHHRDMIAGTLARVLASQNIDPFDLELATTTGQSACVSVSTSTVLSRSGAVILTFRDVTAQRALETELRSTKEFLERLIDSTVDAIIAADMRGTIILFNQGAERLFGFPAHMILGKVPVWDLYPDGVARQVMRMLRSTSYGGVGRLEQTRREIKTRTGEVIPVTMTASIVYEGDEEVATVGIISDLRERIRIEQRLLQAQEKLQITEKQALVAELAGAAAHELNQPLTSIMGYAQLIQRQSAAGAPHMRAVGIILSEAERMADIVKKIGRITKYETTEYVGTASIIDLDRSTAGPDSVPPGMLKVNADGQLQVQVPIPPPSAVAPASDSTPTESRLARGDESIDDEGLTREFTAIRPTPELLAALGDLGFDDPAIDRPAGEVGARVPSLPRLPSRAPTQSDPDSTTDERPSIAPEIEAAHAASETGTGKGTGEGR